MERGRHGGENPKSTDGLERERKVPMQSVPHRGVLTSPLTKKKVPDPQVVEAPARMDDLSWQRHPYPGRTKQFNTRKNRSIRTSLFPGFPRMRESKMWLARSHSPFTIQTPAVEAEREGHRVPSRVTRTALRHVIPETLNSPLHPSPPSNPRFSHRDKQ